MQLIRRSGKKTQHFYSFNAGLKKTQLLRSFFEKAAEKPAFTQLLRRAAFNFGKFRIFEHQRKNYERIFNLQNILFLTRYKVFHGIVI